MGKSWCCTSVVLLLSLTVAHGQSGATKSSGPTNGSPPASVRAANQDFIDWTRDNAIRLETVEAGHGFNDMQPLKQVVGNSRIVALGEATHGTREFFQLKHRMIEFLAAQKGFTIFSIEANMPEAYRLNDYVLNGKGDPKELLKGMYFWTWNTQEVLDMILWMREFNRSGAGRIEFTGFDMQTPTVSTEVVRAFVEQNDAASLPSVNQAYRNVKRIYGSSGASNDFGVATARFPVALVAGKHIKYSGFIRTEAITRGWAGLWWRVDGESKTGVVFDNMGDRGPKGTTPWTRYEISLDVPANAKNINFGVLHVGDGAAWFDTLQLDIDGVRYTDTSLFDLDFESAEPRGFYTGGRGYEVTLDKTIFHAGTQSLRSKLVKEGSTKNEEAEIDQKQLMQDCRKILEHLEAGRSDLIGKTNENEVDWVIQNARLVVQYMQLQTKEKTRDQSMAENVKWIADHNPGAKLVLWAHNGHVAYDGYSGYSPMGKYLRQMFGADLLNCGFSFDEGAFQAMEMGKGLHNFTVGPAPEGSLDQTLAASGIPILALDLRRLPKQGPIAEWAAKPHASRNIGAVYSEGNAASYFQDTSWQSVFDVILFVEKTTAARANR